MDHSNYLNNCIRSSRIGLYRGLGIIGILLTVVGCSRGPSKVDVPSYDPRGAASRAMKEYDTNQDGFIAGEELDKAAGLKAAMKTFDSDQDGKISQQEITERVATWARMGVGITKFNCIVTLDGSPLEGATITFVPEKFLAELLQEAQDVTNLVGTATPRIPKEKRPSPDTPPGMQVGLYQVVISKKQGDEELIPAKYNTATTLGQEVANDDWAIANNRVQFNLTSK